MKPSPFYTFLLVTCASLVDAMSFHEFKNVFNKTYDHDHDHREQVYLRNLQWIQEHNKNRSFDHEPLLKVNQHADLALHEFKDLHKRSNWLPTHFSDAAPTTHLFSSTDDSSFDWRQQGKVNSVRDQGNCGSCWAFAAVSVIESQVAIKTGTLPSLSEQQVVDCSDEFDNAGCDGGVPDNAFEYAAKNMLCSSTEYEYKGVDQPCEIKNCSTSWRVVRSIRIQPKNETLLKFAVFRHPVSAAIEAYGPVFQFYSSGIIQNNCGTNLDHAVVIVGYGSESGVPFWIVRNSWGPEWGEDGYVRIVRDKNMCGIASVLSIVVLD